MLIVSACGRTDSWKPPDIFEPAADRRHRAANECPSSRSKIVGARKTVNHISSQHRSTMTDYRWSSLAMFGVESELLRSLSFDDVIIVNSLNRTT